jgi:hypothetical protein
LCLQILTAEICTCIAHGVSILPLRHTRRILLIQLKSNHADAYLDSMLRGCCVLSKYSAISSELGCVLPTALCIHIAVCSTQPLSQSSGVDLYRRPGVLVVCKADYELNNPCKHTCCSIC